MCYKFYILYFMSLDVIFSKNRNIYFRTFLRLGDNYGAKYLSTAASSGTMFS